MYGRNTARKYEEYDFVQLEKESFLPKPCQTCPVSPGQCKKDARLVLCGAGVALGHKAEWLSRAEANACEGITSRQHVLSAIKPPEPTG